MLTEQDFIRIERQANQLYADLELEIIEEIATRIANFGYANTVVSNDVKIAEEMGVLYQDIVSLVAKETGKSEEQIAQIFNDAGSKTIASDDEIYKEAGLDPTPLSKSESIKQTMNATIQRTAGNLKNLVLTTPVAHHTQLYKAMKKLYMEVSTGVKSYTQSILDAIKDISSQGAYIIYPSGRKMSLESAVRMNIITSINQNCGKLQELRADEMGWDLMELTAHSGARPSHAEWQGKIVSRSGKKGYLSFSDIGYGEVTGFKGINCRHDWHPYHKGSARAYSQEQLTAWRNEKVEYNGKKISKYEATQIQRRMERQIRKDKKEIAGLQGILTSKSKDSKLIEDTKAQLIRKQSKLKEHNSLLNNFIRQTNSPKDYNRLVVGNIKSDLDIAEPLNSIIKRAPNQKTSKKVSKIVDKYDKKRTIKIDYLNKKPFQYSVSQKRILVNPNHPDFDDYNINESIVHEIAHMVDIDNNISTDTNLRNKINDLSKKILNRKEELNSILESEKYRDNIFISDLFAGITKNEIYGQWGHPDNYWKNDNDRFCEIVANIETIYLKNDKEGIKLINNIPELKEIFKEVIKKYGKVI